MTRAKAADQPAMFSFRLGSPSFEYVLQAMRTNELQQSLLTEWDGHCVAPAKLAGRAATLHLSAVDELENPEFLKARREHRSLGYIIANKNTVEATVYLPPRIVLTLLGPKSTDSGPLYLSVQCDEYRAGRGYVSSVFIESERQFWRSAAEA